MEIAVLLSTYNGRRFLPAQLESLANQTVARNMTVYIRDDGGPDNTADIAEQWKDRLSIRWISAQNLGPAKSFWALLCDESIQADYYAFCDQDDIWDTDKLEIAISNLNEHTHFYACNCRLVDGQGEPLSPIYQESVPEISVPRLFVAGVVQGCAMVFDHKLRNEIVSKNLQCIPMHDILVMLYALPMGEVVWDHQPRFSYRVHDNNVVARENKSILKKLRTTWWNWKNSSKNSMSTVAGEMLDKAGELSPDDRHFLKLMRRYRRNLAAKWKLLWWKFDSPIPKRVMRSYRVRLLLNLL